ncbi:hypothetical protein DPMN_096762 [Dreissena polymorpha]|uniref:Uncharacterized protein n=1 Tax=Dreissena polymorpha TaxID=45954 RepID=A0A9D4LAE0_DREPO|nr:hypothetical protein DPMN_096762 [Dreissena polymorpha]
MPEKKENEKKYSRSFSEIDEVTGYVISLRRSSAQVERKQFYVRQVHYLYTVLYQGLDTNFYRMVTTGNPDYWHKSKILGKIQILRKNGTEETKLILHSKMITIMTQRVTSKIHFCTFKVEDVL